MVAGCWLALYIFENVVRRVDKQTRKGRNDNGFLGSNIHGLLLRYTIPSVPFSVLMSLELVMVNTIFSN